MDIQAAEDAITNQLSAAFNGTTFTAQSMPDNDGDIQRAVPNPIAYVLNTGSYPIEIISTDPVVQRRMLKFNVECYSKLRKGVNGLAALKPLLESALIGFMPPSCKRLYLVKDDLLRGDDSIFCHVYSLECETTLIQNNFSEPIVIASFQGIGADPV